MDFTLFRNPNPNCFRNRHHGGVNMQLENKEKSSHVLTCYGVEKNCSLWNANKQKLSNVVLSYLNKSVILFIFLLEMLELRISLEKKNVEY